MSGFGPENAGEMALNAREMSLLLLWRRTSPQCREAVLAAIHRAIDGQSFEEAMIEALIELGETPDAAREEVRTAIEGPRIDWRTVLT